MNLIPIFVDSETSEGLYAIQYLDGDLDEFERLFDLWNDIEFITQYFATNQKHIVSEYFANVTIDELITKILNEVEELENLLESYSELGFKKAGSNLQMLFKPLHNKQYTIPPHQETKAKIDDKRNFPKPLLRLYGIRLGDNTFVITGGAIKLTKTMEEHPDTITELKKIETVKSFLRKNNIIIDNDLIYYYDQL